MWAGCYHLPPSTMFGSESCLWQSLSRDVLGYIYFLIPGAFTGLLRLLSPHICHRIAVHSFIINKNHDVPVQRVLECIDSVYTQHMSWKTIPAVHKSEQKC